MRTPKGLAPLLCIIFWSLPAMAQVLKPAEVPDSIPDPARTELMVRRFALLDQLNDLTHRTAAFNKKYADVVEGSPEHRQALKDQADLRALKTAYVAGVTQFAKDLEAAVQPAGPGECREVEEAPATPEEIARLEKSYSAHLDAAFAPDGSFLHDNLMSLESAAHKKLDQLPRQAQSAAYDWAVSTFNKGLQKEGLPPMTAEQSKGLTDSFNKLLARPCSDLGTTMCDQLQLGVKESASQPDAGALFEKVQLAQAGYKALAGKVDFVMSIQAGAFSLNTNRELGVKYDTRQLLDFFRTGQTKTLVAPLTANLNKVTIDLTKMSADWSVNVSGTWTFCNEAGRLKCPWKASASGSWRF